MYRLFPMTVLLALSLPVFAGDEDLHACGPDAVRFYTKRKTITQRWPSACVREGSTFSFPSAR